MTIKQDNSMNIGVHIKHGNLHIKQRSIVDGDDDDIVLIEERHIEEFASHVKSLIVVNPIQEIISMVYRLVTSEVGDGDAILLIYKPIEEIIADINIFSKHTSNIWNITDYVEDGTQFAWGNNQEWVTITNDKQIFCEFDAMIKIKI